MSPGDLFFEPFFSAPRRRVSAIQGIRVLPLYSCRLSRLLRMVLLEEVIRYAALGPIFEPIFFFPIFLFFPRDSDAGGIQWGARSKFSFREESFRGRVSGEGLCGYSLGTHLSPLLWGWIFFPLSLFQLSLVPVWLQTYGYLVVVFIFLTEETSVSIAPTGWLSFLDLFA